MTSDVVVGFDVTGPVVEWRGPAPHHVPEVTGEPADQLREVSRHVTHGWETGPVRVRVGGTTLVAAPGARGGGVVVPLRAAVRRWERIDPGAVGTAHVQVLGQA